MDASSYVPYCGFPPVPGQLTWNLDPVLIALLTAVPVLYGIGSGRPGKTDRLRQLSFYLGWAILAAALVSPLCNLSVALFSARVAQHMIVTLVAAPLIVLGKPGAAFRSMLPTGSALRSPRMGDGILQLVATTGFAAALWVWHLPGPYDATLQSDVIYWTMHATIFGTALLLWHALFRRLNCVSSALLVGFGSTVQMSLLSALLTLAPRPLFVSHAGTTWPWGLSPLEDQQLGGLIMWVPGGTLFTLIGVLAFGAWLKALSGDASVRQVS
ncbi:cytochrome c oxidase assembly protein [Microvirga sp. 2YAF29]|uniref:cytochrome c oxidase assembly protein n=1 Tax=Microvirga sp. 2YAF29 TaxID=3233031 RepID=UPI003F94D8CF